MKAALRQWYRQDFAVATPTAIAFDGVNIWIGNGGNNSSVTRLRPSNGQCINPCVFFVGDGSLPEALVFDGTYIWVASSGTD